MEKDTISEIYLIAREDLIQHSRREEYRSYIENLEYQQLYFLKTVYFSCKT